MSAVVKLPTAARRRVDNNRFADQRRAVRALRTAEPWPGEYLLPGMREERRTAEALAELNRTPELFAILAILTAFPANRLPSLAATADLLLTRDGSGDAARIGHALVQEAVALRRAMETIARTEREGR
jgi:hypothetical protein